MGCVRRCDSPHKRGGIRQLPTPSPTLHQLCYPHLRLWSRGLVERAERVNYTTEIRGKSSGPRLDGGSSMPSPSAGMSCGAGVLTESGPQPATGFESAKTTRLSSSSCASCFGLTNAPSTFQSYIDKCLRLYLDDSTVCYLDDILIYSNTPEGHEQHVKVLALQYATTGAAESGFDANYTTETRGKSSGPRLDRSSSTPSPSMGVSCDAGALTESGPQPATGFESPKTTRLSSSSCASCSSTQP